MVANTELTTMHTARDRGGVDKAGEVSEKTSSLQSGDSALTSSRKTYKDPKGVTRTWESAERTTRPKNSDIDGVGIVAILEKETGEQLFQSWLHEPRQANKLSQARRSSSRSNTALR